ncbi:cytochrome P450 2J2-like [Empidonax traillii]|uniref:cytochrome P450 2J2-like n=1 Tax=Empidonax traillii TaxID=164674 RepID=UPI000FFD3CB0|nr:cytochrome P450 2J2-like [Empidonax traillii]
MATTDGPKRGERNPKHPSEHKVAADNCRDKWCKVKLLCKPPAAFTIKHNMCIKTPRGNPFDPQFTLTNAVSNVICSLIFGNRFDYQDEEFRKLLKLLHETFVLQGAITTQLYNAFPSIMKFLPGAHQTIFKNSKILKSYMEEQINKHKEDWNPSESRDYIDSYLQEIAKDKGSDTFREEHLIMCSLDLMFAGTETTSSTLRWALLFMASYPEIQGTSSKRSVLSLPFIPHSFVRDTFLEGQVGNLPALTQNRCKQGQVSP